MRDARGRYTSSAMDAVKPCPWCGSEVNVHQGPVFVECEVCRRKLDGIPLGRVGPGVAWAGFVLGGVGAMWFKAGWPVGVGVVVALLGMALMLRTDYLLRRLP